MNVRPESALAARARAVATVARAMAAMARAVATVARAVAAVAQWALAGKKPLIKVSAKAATMTSAKRMHFRIVAGIQAAPNSTGAGRLDSMEPDPPAAQRILFGTPVEPCNGGSIGIMVLQRQGIIPLQGMARCRLPIAAFELS